MRVYQIYFSHVLKNCGVNTILRLPSTELPYDITYLDNYFCSLCFAARCCANFICALLSASDCFVFANARLYDSVHSQHNNLPST